MEHNKKRRNSILKKPPTNSEETTTEVASKIIRRISFSGKKSVKEFRAGEEEATIWGTSYEESAEILHANSTESGLVNVNEKRIILRNRRVIVEQNQTTQRRSKKKASIAENDKENVFVQQPQAQACSLNDITHRMATAESATKTESPVKSELALVKNNFEDKNSQTMSEPLDRANICSSTFDFINYSGLINKTITIEQSVDVTLDENELQLFKFRVPVRATDVSPNMSLSTTRDGSSPNIFSQSIMMSEEDMNMLKIIRGKREAMNLTESQLTEEQKQTAKVYNPEETMTKSRQSDLMQLSRHQTVDDEKHTNQSMNVSEIVPSHSKGTQRKTIIEVVDMEEDTHKKDFIKTLKPTNRGTLLMNQNMNVSEVVGAKSLKRKTITKVENMEERNSFRMDSKTAFQPTAMNCSSMDINSPLRKKPMHNATNYQMDITNVPTMDTSKAEAIRRQTIHFDSAAVEETLICDEAEMTCQSPNSASMEQSIAVTNAARQTIYFDQNQIREDSICQSTSPAVASMELSTCVKTLDCVRDSANEQFDVMEESPKNTKAHVTSYAKNRQTIYTPAEIDVGSPLRVVSAIKPRESIYASSDIVEDSPSPKKAQTFKVTRPIFADITENAGPAPDSRRQRESIFTPVDIIEDSPKIVSQTTNLGRQTIYASADIEEEQVQPLKGTAQQRQSIYTPTDIIEDSPKPIKKTTVIQSVCIPSDMIEDSPLDGKSNILPFPEMALNPPEAAPSLLKPSFIQRQSVAMVDNQKAIKPMGATTSKAAHRHSIYTPSAMIEDSPMKSNQSTGSQRKTTFDVSEMAAESPDILSLKTVCDQPQTKTHRQSIYTPTDIVEDSPSVANCTETNSMLRRKSTHIVSEMAVDSPEMLNPSLKSQPHRQTIHTPADMIEDFAITHHQTSETGNDVILETGTKIPVPKVVVRHLNLKQGISGQQVALRVLQNQQAKTKVLVEPNKDDSSMDMSIHSELQRSANKMNYWQLNEEMLKGKNKDIAEERKGKSLFDDLKMNPNEEIKFDSFMDKASMTGGLIQPGRNSMKDYTMELSMKKSFSNQRKHESEYTMDLSPKKTADTLSNMEECKTEATRIHKSIDLGASTEDNRQRIDFPLNNELVQQPKAVDSTIELPMQQFGHASKYTNVSTKLKGGESLHYSNPQEDDDTMDLCTIGCSNSMSQSKLLTVQGGASQGNDDTMDLCTMGYKSQPQSAYVRAIPTFQGNPQDYDLSTIDPMKQSKRRTINVNNEMDLDESRAETEPSVSNFKDGQSTARYSNREMEAQLELPQASARQTIYFDHNLEVDELQTAPSNAPGNLTESCTFSKRATIHLNEDIELDAKDQVRPTKLLDETTGKTEMPGNEHASKTKCHTIHFNQDLEMEEHTSGKPASSRENTQKQQIAVGTSSGRTLHFNDDIDLDKATRRTETERNTANNGQRIPLRQTIHFHEDLDVEEDSNDKQSNYRKSPAPSRENIEKQQTNDLKASSRLTLHFNDDIELEEEEPARQTALSYETKRNTADNRHRMVPAVVTKEKRQTIYFNEDLEVEEDTSDKSSGQHPFHFNYDIELDKVEDARAEQRNRQTINFPNDMEKSVFQHSRRDLAVQEEPLKGLPKPRRLTILDDQPIDVDESPQKCTVRKSSFSRTLNFNEVQKATSKILRDTVMGMTVQEEMALNENDDSPLYYFNAKSKRHDVTSEIDRSLAEYLKLEAAATLVRRNSQDTSMDNGQKGLQTRYDNEQPSQSKRQTTYEPVNIFEESGMQPLQEGTAHITTLLHEAEQSIQNSDSLMRSKMDTIKKAQINVQANRINLNLLDGLDGIKRSEPANKMKKTGGNMQGNRISLKMFDDLEQKPNRSPHKCVTRKTILAPAAMECDNDNSMETSIMCEEAVKLVKTKEARPRKTIHFTNENAVDESFFDENLSKPVAPMDLKDNQTVFFNEPKNLISETDVTVGNSMSKSKAVQSMKEILFESKMLFTQSGLLQPSTFGDKRSTIYFTGKDDSMDMTRANESMECDVVECVTPTKNTLSKSRIPQLIGSAKKLESMKKSMEYIQQELPNIGCRLQQGITAIEPDEIHQTEAVAANLQNEPVLLQESFETVEIPRRVTTHSSRELQESPHLETQTPEQANLQESFDTIEIPRRATTFQKNDTLQLCSNATINTSQKSLYKLEDDPITISDVSTFFAQRPRPANEAYSPNTTEALCNLDVNVIAVDDQLPKSSDSEDTTHHFDKFKKRYVELTCDSIRMEDIDKTRLSLVNTMDEEASEMVQPSDCPEKVPSEMASPLKPMASVCRKCKRHRLSVTQNDTTIGSFMLEPEPEYKLDFSALQELASKPKIRDVAKIWRQRMRESDSFNVSEGSRSTVLEDDDTVDKFIAELNKKRLATASQLRQRKTIKEETSFVHRVQKRMESEKSNWILNELLLGSNILRLSHTRIRTFAIFISFTPKDPRGIEVNFDEIKLAPNVLHTRQWTAFDSALHYQLLVELPFDLRKLCPTSDDLFEMLQHVEEVTRDVLKTGKDMLYLVLTSPASLVRESSGSIYIRKCARTKTQQNDVRRTEFLIEVRNMKQLSYKSIVVPPLYEFDEKIQMLPVGPEFLAVFLADPTGYMKAS